MFSAKDPERKMEPAPVSRPSLVKRILFTMFTVVVILVLLDQAARCYLLQTVGGQMAVLDENLLFALRPGAKVRMQVGVNDQADWGPDAPWINIIINQDGYRGPRVAKAKNPGELRIICFGDSITMGLDVNEDMTYPAQLYTMLSRQFPGQKISVINAGVLGYSSRQGLYIFKDKFLAYQPDIVIWGFGFNDNSTFGFLTQTDVSLIPINPGDTHAKSLKNEFLFWVFRRPLVQIFDTVVVRNVGRVKIARFIGQLDQVNKKDLEKMAPLKPRLENYNNCRVPPRDFQIHLLQMADLAEQHNFQLIVATFFGTPDLYREIARDFCHGHQISYLDFAALFNQYYAAGHLPDTPEYQQMFKFYEHSLDQGALEKNPMLYLTTDSLHPNNVGHHIIAATLAELVEKMLKKHKS